MKIIEHPDAMQETALAARAAGRRLALVPTMGNLHEGHLSLIRLARQQADDVIVSNFVNPRQFGPNEDYAAYPRTFAADCRLSEAAGADIIFHPSAEAMYPPGSSTIVAEESLSRHLCGASRPGHFTGVCTVVAKLFHLTQPHIAIFGEKDAQQLRIIRRMVNDLDFPVTILAAPTCREADGLAMSSRNRFIPAALRPQAAGLFQTLNAAETAYQNGERNANNLLTLMQQTLARTAPDAVVDYLSLVDDETLQPLSGAFTRPALAAIAAHLGPPRLIDNRRLAAEA